MKPNLLRLPMVTGYSLTYECCYLILDFEGTHKLYGFSSVEESKPIFQEIEEAINTDNTANTVKFGGIDIPYLTEATKEALLNAMQFTAKYAPVRIQL